METRGDRVSILKIVAVMLACVFVMQLLFHLMFFGTGLSFFLTDGLQGKFGQLSSVISFRENYSGLSAYSFRILVIELLALLAYLGYSGYLKIRNHNESSEIANGPISIMGGQKKPTENEKHGEEMKLPEIAEDSSRIKTDIDVLYTLLKEKRKISFPAIEKTFKVDRDTVTSWAHILESGNLALIYQPKFGEPELWLDEK